MNRQDLISPESYNLIEEIEKYADGTGRPALIFETIDGVQSEMTYDELLAGANKIANALTKRGLKKGDRILIMMPRGLTTYVVYTGAMKAGLVTVPCSEMLRPKDLTYRLDHSEARAVFVHESLTDRVDAADTAGVEIKMTTGTAYDEWVSYGEAVAEESDQFEAPETSRGDTVFISYTSGTTGNPKGVVHTHGWGYAHLRTAAVGWMDIKEGDKVWATAGPGWQKWIWSPFISTLGSGAAGFVYGGPFDPEKYLSLLQDQKVNVLCCTPTEYRLMAKVDGLEKYNLDSITSAVSAGEPLNREVIDTFQRYFDVTVRDGYGQTENTLLLGALKGIENKPGSMGKPTPGNQVEIITEAGDAADVDEVGDIAVHKDTPALFKHYFKDEDRTQASYRGDYYVTGDRARKDKEGYFWFEGRRDDIIISSGYTIGPFEVEDALVKHPQVKECAVVASPDEVRGNIVKAFVIIKNPEDGNEALVKELQNWVKEQTAPYKYPRKIEFVDALPKTTSGKIRRIELREQEARRKQSN